MARGNVTNPEQDGRVKDPKAYRKEHGMPAKGKAKSARSKANGKSGGDEELHSVEDLFKHLLQDMYYAEDRITKALPKMAKKASNSDLKQAFETHLEETRDQIEKLKQVFDVLGYETSKEECDAIKGLLDEGEELMEEAEKGEVLDSAMIAAAQKVEHYEIASYGTLCSMAKKLGETRAASLLHEILEQEKATDSKLTRIADKVCSGKSLERA